MKSLNKELTELLNYGVVKLKSEQDTIELTQQLRYNGFDMEKVEIDLNW